MLALELGMELERVQELAVQEPALARESELEQVQVLVLAQVTEQELVVLA